MPLACFPKRVATIGPARRPRYARGDRTGMTTTDDLQHHPRLPRVLAAAGAVLSLAGVLLAGAAPAGAQSQAPRCAGEQWLTSISFGPSIQGFFNCDSRIRSFRVHTTAHVV